MSLNNLYLALIHYPVVNRKKKIIGSALTTIDMHDIARAARTFGVKKFFVVTPFEDQQKLAEQVIEHWTRGIGGELNPFRKEALELIEIASTFEEVVLNIEAENKGPVTCVATSAASRKGAISTAALQQKLIEDTAHVIAFGTAWGLADEFIETCDFILEPINGKQTYNHLSVRSAVSIYLDRICNSLIPG